jgi:hypothetical protein
VAPDQVIYCFPVPADAAMSLADSAHHPDDYAADASIDETGVRAIALCRSTSEEY